MKTKVKKIKAGVIVKSNDRALSDYVRKNMTDYSKEVAEDRTLPDLKDGFKPVQRRIIWAMNELKAYSTSKTLKCGRIVGETMGKFHPHGDCLAGSTKVLLLSGKTDTLEHLCSSNAGKRWILAFDKETGKLVPALAHSWRIGQYANEVYEIYLSNGQKLPVCTSNHPFFVEGKGWVKASKLTNGDILLGGNISKEDYKTVYWNDGTSSRRELLHHLVAEHTFENYGEKNTEIHHINSNSKDNRPNNLTIVPKHEHSSIHKIESSSYKKGLDAGREAMFGGDKKLTRAIHKKNSLLMKLINKNQVIIKAVNAVKSLKEKGLDINPVNYTQLRSEIYNLPKLDTIYEKGYTFEDLVRFVNEGGFKIDTSSVKGLTKNIKREKSKTAKRVSLFTGSELHSKTLTAASRVLSELLKSGKKFNWKNYKKIAKKFAINNNSSYTDSYLPLYANVKELKNKLSFDSIKQLPKLMYNSNGVYVTKIVKHKVHKLPMYDFTVDTYHNMAIITEDNNRVTSFIFAHNSSIYMALVTMANDCSPLIAKQGNFGSLTDPPAAARYTEARLSKLGMKTIECNEVADYIPNYTGDMQEPVVIPTRIPYYLLNGSSGIAVGLACNMPSHNLGELIEAYKYVIRKGESATTKGVMKYLKGPEYEYGGRILSDEKEIRSLYKTGKGPIRYSCDYKFEKAKDGSLTLVITEPCPTFNPAKFLLAMSDLMEDKIVTRADDCSTKKDGFRLEVDLKSPAVFEKYIRKHLEKQVTYQYYAIDRQPAEDTTERDVDVQVLSPNLLEAMHAWIDWRRVVETKMLKLELKRARDKLFKEKLRLDASQNIDIIMAAVKQDKIEPREYLVKKLPILIELVKRGKKEKAFIGADYIGSQQIFSLKKADQSKLKDMIKDSLKNIKRIKYDLEHIDNVLIHYLNELKPFATPRKLKVAGSFEETKLRANKNAELQICGASADCKKEVINLNSRSLGSKYFTSTYDSVYYCNSDGQMAYCDAFEFSGKDKGTTCIGLTSADVNRFIVRTNKGIHISENDGKDFFNTVKMKDDEQAVQMEGLYKKSKLLFVSGNGLVKVVESDKYESNRRNTGSHTSGTGFKNIKAMAVIPSGCLVLTMSKKLIEPEKLKSFKDFVGVIGDKNFVVMKNGKKLMLTSDEVKNIKEVKQIYRIVPIKFAGRK